MPTQLLSSRIAYGSFFQPVAEHFDDVKKGMEYSDQEHLSLDTLEDLLIWAQDVRDLSWNWQSVGALNEAFQYLERAVHVMFYVIENCPPSEATQIQDGEETRIIGEGREYLKELKNIYVDDLIDLYLKIKEQKLSSFLL